VKGDAVTPISKSTCSMPCASCGAEYDGYCVGDSCESAAFSTNVNFMLVAGLVISSIIANIV